MPSLGCLCRPRRANRVARPHAQGGRLLALMQHYGEQLARIVGGLLGRPYAF